MSTVPVRRVYGPALRWRTLEWWAAGATLVLLSGIVVPVIDSDGYLDPGEQNKLKLLGLLIYAIAGVVLARHPMQLLIALRRNLPLAIVLALAFASVGWSISPSVTLQRAIALTGSVAVAFVVAIRFTPRQFLLLAAITLGSCMVLSLLLVGASPHRAISMEDGTVRGIFTNKNVLGWHAAVAALAAGAMALECRGRMRYLALGLLGASLICLVGSRSATALVSFVSAILFAWFYLGLKRSRGLGRIVLVLGFIQLVVLAAVSLTEFLVPALEALGKDATLTGRVPLWVEVDKEIGRRLFLGWGYQAFWADASGEGWRVRAAAGWAAPHAHNGFRDVLLSFGLAGFVPFVVMVVRALRDGAVLLCGGRGGPWLWMNTYVCMFLVMNLTESMFFFQNHFLFVLFATVTIMFALRGAEMRGAGRRETEERGRGPAARRGRLARPARPPVIP